MQYRRRGYPMRRNSGVPEPPVPNGALALETIKAIEEIPLPNEVESARDQDSGRALMQRGFPFNLLSNLPFAGDEIILIGLIVLLLNERVEDDFLIVLLVYILIT